LLPMVVVVALKVADVAAPATATDAGTVRVALVLVRVTVAPPVGAGLLRVTVQVLEALGPRLVGLQTSEETRTGATRATVVLAEVAPKLAVRVALWSLEITDVVAANVVVVAPAFTVNEAGAARAPLVVESVTAVPPAGAALESVIVHVVKVFWPMLAGLHDSDDTPMGTRRLTLAEAPVLCSVAVIVAV